MSPSRPWARTSIIAPTSSAWVVVLYELATGQRPFLGATFSEIVNNIVHTQPAAIARLNYNVPPSWSVSRSSVCRNRPIAAIRRLGS